MEKIHYKNMEILYEKSVYTKDLIRKVNIGVYGGGILTLVIAFITYFLTPNLLFKNTDSKFLICALPAVLSFGVLLISTAIFDYIVKHKLPKHYFFISRLISDPQSTYEFSTFMNEYGVLSQQIEDSMFKNLNEFVGEKVIIEDEGVDKKELMFVTIDCTKDTAVVTIKNIINTEN